MSTSLKKFSLSDKIRTEIRFAGLENDLLVRQMIRHQFGIAVQDI